MIFRTLIAVSALCLLLPVVSHSAPPHKNTPPAKQTAMGKTPVFPCDTVITIRGCRIRVAEDGAKTRENVAQDVLRGSSGIRLYSQQDNIQFTAVPALNRDQTVNLHMTVHKVPGSVYDAQSFIYQDKLPILSKMPRNMSVQFASIAETDDPQVVASLEKRTPLPTTGKPYSVVILYVSAHVVPR